MEVAVLHKIYKQLKENKFCIKCGGAVETPIINPRPDTRHGNEIRCEHCNRFFAWTGKDWSN